MSSPRWVMKVDQDGQKITFTRAGTGHRLALTLVAIATLAAIFAAAAVSVFGGHLTAGQFLFTIAGCEWAAAAIVVPPVWWWNRRSDA